MSTIPPPVTIRVARPILADATALLAVERRSLGDSPYTPAEALAILRRPEHRAYLALAGGRPVGFCSTLRTPTDPGPRLELDMVGVHPGYRGRGIATSLLKTAIAEAGAGGIRRMRGVVATGNVASQRAFERAGLRRDTLPRDLTVLEVRGEAPLPYLPEGWVARVVDEGIVEALADPPIRLGAHGAGHEVLALYDATGRLAALAEAQRVHTLSYRGLWVERYWAAAPPGLLALALGLVQRARSLDLDEVGHLAPPSPEFPGEDDDAITWARAGFQVAGRYFVYTEGEA